MGSGLRETAAAMRREHGPDHERHAMWAAMADWIDLAGSDEWAFGPLHCADGCDVCDDDLWAHHVRAAHAVAAAYPTPSSTVPGRDEQEASDG